VRRTGVGGSVAGDGEGQGDCPPNAQLSGQAANRVTRLRAGPCGVGGEGKGTQARGLRALGAARGGGGRDGGWTRRAGGGKGGEGGRAAQAGPTARQAAPPSFVVAARLGCAAAPQHHITVEYRTPSCAHVSLSAPILKVLLTCEVFADRREPFRVVPIHLLAGMALPSCVQ